MQLEMIQIKNRQMKYLARCTLFRHGILYFIEERVIEEVHFIEIQNYKNYGYAMVWYADICTKITTSPIPCAEDVGTS